MRRLLFMVVLVAGVMTAVVGFAPAAKPTAGEWRSKHARFTVNAKLTRIKEFSSKCAGIPLPLTMKVTPAGTFSYKHKKGLEGGKPLTEKVKGRFTSATTASVTASYGRCHEKFVAKTNPAPVQTTPTDTTDTTDTTYAVGG